MDHQQIELFVPGRLCLFGEHSDWAGRYMEQNPDVLSGKAIVTGINLGIYAKAEKSEYFEVESLNQNSEKITFTCEMRTAVLREYASQDSFFCYCCGVAAYMRENYRVRGIKIVINRVTLPMKKGLSSSAAVCVLVARAFNQLYSLHMSTRGEMKAAYGGERLTASRCGRLDQACAYGENPVLMEFSDEEITVEKLHVGKTLHWVFADLCAGKNTKKILTHLNRAYPYAEDEISRNVQEALGPDNHCMIAKARELIESGDAEALGRMMNEAQKVFDKKVAPACPEELKSPVLHSVLEDSVLQKWIYGGKGVGSQGDGTVQFLARDKQAQAELVEYLNKVRGLEAFSFNIPAGGKIRRAIIPIAGVGTRMYPATHFVKKAFLPVMDREGIVKPTLLYLLEELSEAEIEEIILIVGEGEEEEYRHYFTYSLDGQFQKKLPENTAPYYEKIRQLGGKLRFVEQREKRGVGHAVYQARRFLKGEPTLLLLGDFLYQSDLEISCTTQVINAYNKSGGKNVVSIKSIPLEQVPNYGILYGRCREDREYLMDVKQMVEKPSVEYAKEYLGVSDKEGKSTYYATFGQYVLTEEIFEYLEQQIEKYDRDGNSAEIDLTSALCAMAGRNELVAVDVAGESFDTGIPSLYFDTFCRYRNL